MIKKYVILICAILVILMLTSTSTASYLSSTERIYERFQENSVFRQVLEKISQIVSNNDNSQSIDGDDGNNEEYDEGDDGNDDEDYDVEYDDGEHDDDSDDGPKEDALLPKIWDMVGEITPDNGNEVVVEENDLGETPTIDTDGEEGATQDEWTVEEGTTTVKLERFVKIVTELNGKLGSMLERVIERTVATDENGISSPGSGDSDSAENIIDNVVVVGGSGGISENNEADVIVLGDQ